MTCILQYGIPLEVVSYKTLYGWTMDEIVKEIGLKNNCTFCGVFRRQVSSRKFLLISTFRFGNLSAISFRYLIAPKVESTRN